MMKELKKLSIFSNFLFIVLKVLSIGSALFMMFLCVKDRVETYNMMFALLDQNPNLTLEELVPGNSGMLIGIVLFLFSPILLLSTVGVICFDKRRFRYIKKPFYVILAIFTFIVPFIVGKIYSSILAERMASCIINLIF